MTTADLWLRFFRHLPLWIVVFVVTWLTRNLVVKQAPLIQLVICLPVGIAVGTAFIFSFSPQRQVALHLLETLRELKQRPLKGDMDYAK